MMRASEDSPLANYKKGQCQLLKMSDSERLTVSLTMAWLIGPGGVRGEGAKGFRQRIGYTS
jgi:hypothetical protein